MPITLHTNKLHINDLKMSGAMDILTYETQESLDAIYAQIDPENGTLTQEVNEFQTNWEEKETAIDNKINAVLNETIPNIIQIIEGTDGNGGIKGDLNTFISNKEKIIGGENKDGSGGIKGDLTNFINNKKNEINKTPDGIKADLTSFIEGKKNEINNNQTGIKIDLTNFIEGKKVEIGGPNKDGTGGIKGDLTNFITGKDGDIDAIKTSITDLGEAQKTSIANRANEILSETNDAIYENITDAITTATPAKIESEVRNMFANDFNLNKKYLNGEYILAAESSEENADVKLYKFIKDHEAGNFVSSSEKSKITIGEALNDNMFNLKKYAELEIERFFKLNHIKYEKIDLSFEQGTFNSTAGDKESSTVVRSGSIANSNEKLIDATEPLILFNPFQQDVTITNWTEHPNTSGVPGYGNKSFAYHITGSVNGHSYDNTNKRYTSFLDSVFLLPSIAGKGAAYKIRTYKKINTLKSNNNELDAEDPFNAQNNMLFLYKIIPDTQIKTLNFNNKIFNLNNNINLKQGVFTIADLYKRHDKFICTNSLEGDLFITLPANYIMNIIQVRKELLPDTEEALIEAGITELSEEEKTALIETNHNLNYSYFANSNTQPITNFIYLPPSDLYQYIINIRKEKNENNQFVIINTEECDIHFYTYNTDENKNINNVFTEEIEDTIIKVLNNATEKTYCFCLLSDTHVDMDKRYHLADKSTDKNRYSTVNDTLNNIREVSKYIAFDGIIHLGDIVDGVQTNYNTLKTGARYINQLKEINDLVLPVLGNHETNFVGDENHAGRISIAQNYAVYGRQNEKYVVRPHQQMYYYCDIGNDLRLVVLNSIERNDTIEENITIDEETQEEITTLDVVSSTSNPKIPQSSKWDITHFGFTLEQIQWLDEVAYNTNRQILLLSHTPCIAELLYSNFGLENATPKKGFSKQYGHYVEMLQTITKPGNKEKTIGFLFGHVHADWRFTYQGIPFIGIPHSFFQQRMTPNQDPNSIRSNIIITNNNDEQIGVIDQIELRYPQKIWTEASRDLWNVLLINPENPNEKIKLIRFGAGIDYGTILTEADTTQKDTDTTGEEIEGDHGEENNDQSTDPET